MPARLPADPNNIYAWQSQPLPTDKLDFRHHNYKEMRKVPALQPWSGAGGVHTPAGTLAWGRGSLHPWGAHGP